MKNLILLAFLILTISCSTETNNSTAKNSVQYFDGKFKLELSNGKGFTHKTKKFKVKSAQNNNWRFEAFGWTISMDAIKFAETSPTTSIDLVYNNTFVFLYMDINNKRTYVSCKPDQDPFGKITRTTLTDKAVSGTFEFTLTKCKDFYTSETIDSINLPIHAKGYFTNIQLVDQFAQLRK
jgi:hypothetical protein